MNRWFVGSLSGERFQSRAKRGSPRRKLPDGRTETGILVADETPDPIQPQDHAEITADDEQITTAEPQVIESEQLLSPQEFDALVGGLDVDDAPETEEQQTKDHAEFETTRQPPKTTQKDHGKMQHLISVAMALMSPQPLTKEQRIELIALLWADTMDVRIQTSQTVLSTKHYAMIAGVLTVAILLKGQTGFKLPKFKGRQTKITDPFDAMDQDDPN